MSSIKKHQCPSCGGNLTVNNDRQMYYCTFCGSTYDYEYFREEQMHTMGETFLSRGEYMAAIDAYRFILKKDPHDFLALRGLMLAAAHLNNIDELISEKKTNDFSYDHELVSEAIEGASEDDKAYFSELGRIYSDKKKLFDLTGEIDSLVNEKRKIADTIRLNGIKRERCYLERNGSEYSPKLAFVMCWILAYVLLTITICIVVELAANESGAAAGLVALFGGGMVSGIVMMNLKTNYPRVKMIKELDKNTGELYAESARLGDKIRDLSNDEEKLTIAIRNASNKLVKEDKLKVSESKTSIE